MDEVEIETLGAKPSGSLAPLLILMIVIGFQFVSRWLELLNKKVVMTATEIQLRMEIKELLKQASSLSQPSTFAQAAKIRRLAAAKERELEKYKELQKKKKKSNLYGNVLLASKVLTYILLIFWYWRVPVAIISQQLVSPFGHLLSLKGGGILNGNIMVGVIPWLMISTRVSKYISQLFKF